MNNNSLENEILNLPKGAHISLNGTDYVKCSAVIEKINNAYELEKNEKEELPEYIIEELNSELFKGEDEDFVLNCFYRESFDRMHGKETFLSYKVLSWFVIKGNVTRLINAIRNGYKPYKKPVWVVKTFAGYLTKFETFVNNNWRATTSGSKDDKDIITFECKEKANEIATLVDGTVEPWE